MQLAIVAGGKGTRLQSRLGGIAKPMVNIGGKPLLEHQIILAGRHGFKEILLLLGYGAEQTQAYFGTGSRWDVHLTYSVETEPLGSAGAVLQALDLLDQRFVLVYGDVMLNVDLGRFWRTHAEVRPAASLLLHPNDHPYDSDLVELDTSGRIIAFHGYPHEPGRFYPNLVNAALYILEKRSLARYRNSSPPLDFGKQLFPAMLSHGEFLYGYRTPEYIKDAGTPERLDAVLRDFESGRVARGSLETAAPAIFFDRDGTLNEEVDRVKCCDEFRLLPQAAYAIRCVNESGYRAVVITNQPVIARGECSEHELTAIHNKMETLLGDRGAYLDGIFYCPHHPDSGFQGERAELKIPCGCRKPGIALIERAARELNIDLSRSWLIGDSSIDVRTARNAGLHCVLVQTGHRGRDGRYADTPDAIAADVHAAVRIALSEALLKGTAHH